MQGLSWSGGTPASASPRSQASKARSVREPETPRAPGFSSTCRKLSVLALSTLDNFCHVLLPVREQGLVPSCRWCVLEGLPGRWRCCPFAAFYFTVADLSGCYVVSSFPFLHVCVQGRLQLKQKGLSWRVLVPHVGHEWWRVCQGL